MGRSIMLFAIVASIAAVGAVSVTAPGDAMAHPYHQGVTTTPINDEISIQKTDVVLSVPSDNALPWGFVTGQASEHVADYPVVIQFYQDGEPVHMAQVDVNEDGSYEYQFRVLSVDLETGHTTHVFEGDYLVSIFKVVPTAAPPVPIAGTV